jgi:hypothetical protein
MPVTYELVRMIEIYDEIEDFEHLIIDIRGNRGGAGLFQSLILWPNINVASQLEAPAGYFFMAGEYNLRFLRLLGGFNNPMIRSEAVALDELGYFPYLNEDDKQLFDYALSVTMTPMRLPLLRPALMSPPPGRGSRVEPFGGKIWLLIDGYGFSAADDAAFLSRYSGFITVVGEQSGGVIGGTEAVWVSLPNSGIILSYDAVYLTDQYGRCRNEHPVKPHYFNRPGMDALETTLALIAEGNY